MLRMRPCWSKAPGKAGCEKVTGEGEGRARTGKPRVHALEQLSGSHRIVLAVLELTNEHEDVGSCHRGALRGGRLADDDATAELPKLSIALPINFSRGRSPTQDPPCNFAGGRLLSNRMAAIATPRAGRVGRGACPAHIALPAVHEHPPLSAPRSAPLDSTPAHNPPPGTHEDAFSTPTAGPLAEGVEPCMQLMPFFCETPAVPTTLEFRSATKLKEKRRQRQLARSPYAKPTRQGKGGGEASVGARRRLLEEEQQRLLGLPRGQYSRHRLSLVGKALEIL